MIQQQTMAHCTYTHTPGFDKRYLLCLCNVHVVFFSQLESEFLCVFESQVSVGRVVFTITVVDFSLIC